MHVLCLQQGGAAVLPPLRVSCRDRTNLITRPNSSDLWFEEAALTGRPWEGGQGLARQEGWSRSPGWRHSAPAAGGGLGA